MILKSKKTLKILLNVIIIATFLTYIIIIEIQNWGKSYQIKIVDYGPSKTNIGHVFNKQADGTAALWIKTEGPKSKSTVAVWDKNYLLSEVYIENNLVTAYVPSELYSTEGKYNIYLFDPESNIKSNKVSFYVYP